MRITYNAPVTLTFAFFAMLILFIDAQLAPNLIHNVFTAEGKMTFDPKNYSAYLRLVTYIFGHVDINHLTSNMMFILLLGPSLEERYSSGSIAIMIFMTALLNGLINAFFFSTMLLGASGIVFMMIVLTSFANVKRGEIPLSFFLVAAMYVWMEVVRAKSEGDISYFAHLLGGICGAIFGLFENSVSRKSAS
ncbi:rhomboid family intramembrane serine protease [Entomospira culicis]|uniref:Rhomboid family intramembrane serine protease n=1 Tax=Entomospira culicis TaxID=2719989 RepID=A0A968GF79_9SPIO|nr:rhomboid family intramembrane serine protease [Entomospira culicis]NIZ18708.1 rhomboid family intramembrane serine protease [Entomospira culicis]NIZ68923.1 rhomboid family intramembrane serine protease [Entomospira culicis]WDI37516.1 rhomboid family intramembrane serine protease [Entomospira culicis]WDI39144.1 rhomboid family intramembrane serine protease [Entomospira culicis]